MSKALLLLSQLDNDDLDWLVKVARKKVLQPDEVLIYENSQINALYIVLSGTFRVLLKALNDEELARIYVGEVIGEISYIIPRPTIATVQAIETSEVLDIPRLELTSRLQWNTGFAARFYRFTSMCLAERMHNTVRRLGENIDLQEIALQEQGVENSLEDALKLAEVKFDWLINNAL
jgi:CRP-like cAMP-binding protein